MGRKQLRPLTSDSLVVFQPTVSHPHSYVCLSTALKVYVISEHLPTAEQTAVKFRSVYNEKCRVIHPGLFSPPNVPPHAIFQMPPGFPLLPTGLPGMGESREASSKPINFVAKGFLFAGRASAENEEQYVDLFDLHADLLEREDETSQGVFFDPDFYPALIWVEPVRSGALSNHRGQLKTVIYPSGLVLVHGAESAELLVECYQRKLPYLMGFLRSGFCVPSV
jgi:hypothetical protein